MRDDVVTVLDDEDVGRLAHMGELVEVCREVLVADATGEAAAPPRVAVDVDPGSLVFTVGGGREAFGFRVYARGVDGPDDQVVATWDRGGGLDGLVVGSALGALRTGAIGGVAVDLLARRDATAVAVVGTGRQARTQLLGAAAVRDLTTVRVHSRDPDRRSAFAAEASRLLDVEVRAVATAQAAVDGADVVLLATTSSEPVVPASVLAPGVHVSTVGPKTRTAHEWPVAFAEVADVLVTDSPQQVADTDDHVLAHHPAWSRIGHLGRLVADGYARGDDEATLYLSTGLAGTEVAVARHLLARHRAA